MRVGSCSVEGACAMLLNVSLNYIQGDCNVSDSTGGVVSALL